MYIYIYIFITYVNPRENTSISVPSAVQYRLGGPYGQMTVETSTNPRSPGPRERAVQLRITPPGASTRAIMSRRGKCKSFKDMDVKLDEITVKNFVIFCGVN